MGNDDITSIAMLTIIVIDIARGPVDACGDLLYPDLDGDGLVPDVVMVFDGQASILQDLTDVS